MQSLSDIDLVCIGEVDADHVESIRSRVRAGAEAVGLVPSGVSVRSIFDLKAMPHFASLDGAAPFQRPWPSFERGIAFWTCVATIEAAITRDRHLGTANHAVVASYTAAKFFFTFARNVALDDGVCLASYADICVWVNQRVPGLPVKEAFAVKRGFQPTLTERTAVELLSPDTLRRFTQVPEIVCSCADDIAGTLIGSRELPVGRYVDEISVLAYNPTAFGVAEYERHKYQAARALCV